MGYGMKIEMWGQYALFSRPELKTERVSYEIITPSAARGVIESIYWHPGFIVRIDNIYVLSPIEFVNIRRNEVKSKVLASNVERMMNGGEAPMICTSEDIQQRAAMVLKNVHYVVEAHFEMTDKVSSEDNAGKFKDIFRRRLDKGQFYSQPYFGCREFPANFRAWVGEIVPAVDITKDLGYMLYDLDYSNPKNIQPMFFHARLEHGVVHVAGEKVLR